jgi:type II secretory pathway component PulF
LGRQGQARQQGSRQVARANEAALRADLRRQGVAATRVKTQSAAFGSGGKVTNEDIAVFSRQLATMMAAGIPMVQAFEIIGNGHEKPAMQKLVLDIKANIEGGSTLHESLAKHFRCTSTTCSSTWSRPANRPARSNRCSTRSRPTRKKPRR